MRWILILFIKLYQLSYSFNEISLAEGVKFFINQLVHDIR